MIRIAAGLIVMFGCLAAATEPAPRGAGQPAVRVECYGQLRHGVAAIGGETTGTTIGFDRLTWELKLPDETMKKFAADHHKKPVVAVGSLRRVCGTQIPVRWIVEVERMTEREPRSQRVGAMAIVTGTLKTADRTSGESTQLVVEADGITWPLDFSENKSMLAESMPLVSKQVVVTGLVDRVPGLADQMPGSRPAVRMALRVTRLNLRAG